MTVGCVGGDYGLLEPVLELVCARSYLKDRGQSRLEQTQELRLRIPKYRLVRKIFITTYNARLRSKAPRARSPKARVVKLVDAGDSKSPAARRAGSIPAPGTSIHAALHVVQFFRCGCTPVVQSQH